MLRLVGALSLLLALVVTWRNPVAAATGGGAHSGTMTMTNTVVGFPCVESSLDYSGTGQAVIRSGDVTYDGPISATFSVPKVYQNPTGTHSNTDCTNPGAWAVTSASISGSRVDIFGTTFSVNCSWTSGSYQRIDTAHTVSLPPDAGSCTTTVRKADGTTWTHTSATRVIQEGTTTVCDPPTQVPPTKCSNAYEFTATDN